MTEAMMALVPTMIVLVRCLGFTVIRIQVQILQTLLTPYVGMD